MVEARVSRKKMRLLLDTGASRTVFDHTRLQESFPKLEILPLDSLTTGLGTSSFPGSVAELPSFGLGKLVLKKLEVVVLDLSHVNHSYQKLGLEPIDGVLGSDLLMQFKAIIDYGKAHLTLNPQP